MNHLSDQQVTQLKHQLLQEKSDLEHRFAHSDNYGLSESLSDMSGEFSTYDNHPADVGTADFERGKDLALNENAEQQLKDVTNALEKMDKNEYGVCRTCGQPIPFERLEAIPSTQYCVKHVPEEIVSQRRPIEEEFESPPFGRTSLDEHHDQTQFDGEDAWQIVEEWGTSDSPAMAEDPNDQDNYNDMVIEAGENDGFVEGYESFVATDIFGENVTVYRNDNYRKYMEREQGDLGLTFGDEGDDLVR
jgi:YteA family regulatory protein